MSPWVAFIIYLKNRTMEKFIEKNYKLIIGIILTFIAVVSILNAKNDSLIYDEDAHIPAGYSYLTQHDMRLNPEHPPLLKDLAALPLLFLKPNFDTTQNFWTTDNANDSQWNAGKIFLFDSGNNPDQIIFWSRLPFILLSLILGLFIFKWTREIAGLTAGLFALILYAFDPNILGHNHFVTTDLGIAAFIVFAFYYFLKFIKDPSWKNVFIGSLFLGLVQLAKFSSVLIFPVLGLILIIYPLIRLEKEKRSKLKVLGEYVLKGAVAFVLSLVVVWIVYSINTFSMPKKKLPEIVNHYIPASDQNVKAIYTRQIVFAMNDSVLLRPMANYFFGVARVFQRVAGGNVTYFLGQVNTHGFLGYFPIVFLIKEPLPILFFIIFALFFSLFKIIKKTFEPSENSFFKNIAHYLRTHITEFSMFLFIVLYAFTSIVGRLNIGFRHLFPILPFVYILTTKNIFEFLKRREGAQAKFPYSFSALLLLVFLILGTIYAYPSYMSYFNQAADGPKKGYKLVTDSNADWGQDLKRLKIFLSEHPEINKIRVDYFGMANLDYYLNGKYEKWWAAKRPIEASWYAISVEFMQESIYDRSKPDSETYRWLQNKKPFSQVGTSILVYNITPEDLKN